MSERQTASIDERERIDYGTTLVEVSRRRDGTWVATQPGLDVIGTGESAARATEDMAGEIAERQEAGEL